jgi:cytoskeletal protein CcmA (bactofilin family)
MFRRKEDGSEEVMDENANNDGVKMVTTPGATPSAPVNPASHQQPAFRPVPAQAAIPAARATTPAAAPAMPTEPTRPSIASKPASKRVLTVGPEIQMKGEVTSCDRVVIEGLVDATMRDVHTVELTESGSLKGTAEVEDAEISGSFEGDLVVRGKLTIYASGRVRGNITYGEIEINRGGQISGNVRNAADAKAGLGAPNKRAA